MWHSIDAYCKQKLSKEVLSKLKTTAQKRKYLTTTLGLTLQQERFCVGALILC